MGCIFTGNNVFLKQLLYIFGIVLLMGGISSCSKDELEAPAETESTSPQAISIDGNQGLKGGNRLGLGPDIILESGTGEGEGDNGVDINDDGDNEEEDRSPQKE